MDKSTESAISDELARRKAIERVRRFFQRISKDGKVYSRCLVQDCNRMLAGAQKYNLERHLISVHSIELEETSQSLFALCRLCFTNKSKVIEVFGSTMDVANTIRTHFSCDAVNESDPLPTNICSQCWNQLSKFHNFYVAANEARSNYMANTLQFKDMTMCDVNGDSVGNLVDVVDRDIVVKVECHDEMDETFSNDVSFNDPLAEHHENVNDCEKSQDAMKYGCEADIDGALPAIEESLQQETIMPRVPKASTKTGEQKLRQYFKFVRKDCYHYTECLVKYCHWRIFGNARSRLMKHLRVAHHINMNCSHAMSSIYQTPKISPRTESMDAQKCSSDFNFEEPAYVSRRKELAGCHEHFQRVIKNGKIYSKCLIEQCDRILSGNQRFNLERHLKIKHRMSKPFHSRKSTEGAMIENNAYFKVIRIGRRLFSQCLVAKCQRLLIGKRKFNLERHLKLRHKLDSFITTENVIETELEFPNMEIERRRSHSSKNSKKYSARDDLSNLRVFRSDGETRSEYLMADCDREFLDDSHIDGQLLEERYTGQPLNAQSSLATASNDISQTSNARKYFQFFQKDGKVFSKCLIPNCNRTLSGNQKANLERHLFRVHRNNGVASADPMDETVLDDQDNKSRPHGVYISYDSDSLSGSFFENVIKDGKHYYKCTIENCYRILPAEEYLLRRHLNVIHKTDASHEPSAREYFERVTDNGQFYNKCLVNNCGRMLAGDQKFNLQRHLRLVHKKF